MRIQRVKRRTIYFQLKLSYKANDRAMHHALNEPEIKVFQWRIDSGDRGGVALPQMMITS